MSSWPSNRMLPVTSACSGANPITDSADSVLPEPDSPMIPSRRPASRSNETRSTTVLPPKRTVRSRTSSRLIRAPHPVRWACGSAWARPVASLRRRRVGSIASRSPSPSRLNPSVASTTAMPGNTIAHGCTVTDCWRPWSMRPHDGVATGVRPRKLSAASASDGERGDDRQLHDHGRADVRHDVPPDRAHGRRSRRVGGDDVVAGEHGVRLALDDAGEHDAGAEPDRQRHGPQRAAERGDEHEREHEPRQGDEHVDQVHGGFADPAGSEGAEDAHRQADHGGDHHRHDHDEQGRSGADQHLAEQVLAGTVGAEPMGRRRSAASGRRARPCAGRGASTPARSARRRPPWRR